jgi:hypothetical protein
VKVVPATPAQPAVATPAVETPTGPTGTLELQETAYDAGKVARGDSVSHTFLLKNIGKGDLTVEAKAG